MSEPKFKFPSLNGQKCKDYEVCGNLADPAYTMDYTDVKPGAYIYWCSKCGPTWHAVEKTLTEKLKDPEFKDKFEAEVNKHSPS